MSWGHRFGEPHGLRQASLWEDGACSICRSYGAIVYYSVKPDGLANFSGSPSFSTTDLPGIQSYLSGSTGPSWVSNNTKTETKKKHRLSFCFWIVLLFVFFILLRSQGPRVCWTVKPFSFQMPRVSHIAASDTRTLQGQDTFGLRKKHVLRY